MDEPPRDMNRPTRSAEPRVVDSANAATLPDKPGAVAPSRSHGQTGAFDPPAQRFETRGELGRGGMGAVIDAYDTALRRPVAIKQVLATSADALARFEREAQITALLEHPGIVPIHDAGRDPDGTPYYVMRRVDGEPLDKVVDRRSFADRIARVPNVLAACDATAFAHSRGVIHRDIKPANILIGPFGETLLIDWGLARRIDADDDPGESRASVSGLTRVGSVAGTPGFMSPEQARAEPLDARADVFALGATLFYVLSGRLAYSASGATEMIDQIGTGKTPDWRRLPEDTPRELRAIIEKAMAFELQDRYVDAGALAADLRRYVTGQLVGAYRYGWFEQVRRFVRRHRAAVAVGVIALLVIATGATISVRRVIDERDDARRARAIAEANQREANAKRDQLIVQNALKLAEAEPAAAIATLRRLPPESSEWRRAASAAAAAAARGIPFGFAGVIAPNDTGWLSPSPDSRRLLVYRFRDDRLTLVDLVTRTRTEIGEYDSLSWMTWLDDRTLVGASRIAIVLIDIPTRTARRLPADRPIGVSSDHTGHAFIQVTGNKVFRIDAASTELGPPIVENATAVLPISGQRAIVHRERRVELWSPTGTRPIVEDVEHAIVANDRLAIRTSKELCIWDVRGEPTRESCSPTADSTAYLLGLTRRELFVMGVEGISVATPTGPRSIARRAGALSATPHGFVFSPVAGEIEIWDDSGRFAIRAGATDYRTITQTADRRFVAALASTGDLMIWDLSTFRPRVIDLGDRELLGLSRTGLWTYERNAGVYRYDRKTGEDVLRVHGPTIGGDVDPDERWLMTGRPVGGLNSDNGRVPMINTLYNLRTRAEIIGGPEETLGFTAEGAFGVDVKGGITLIAEDGTRRPAGSFPGAAISIGAAGDYIATLTANQEVCRYSRLAGTSACSKLAKPARHVAVDASGAVWLLGDGALARWDGSGAAKPVWPAIRFMQFVWTDNQLIAAAPSGLVNLSDPIAQPVAFSPMMSFAPASKSRIVATTASKQTAVIDVKNGLSYELPGQPSAMPEVLRSDGSSLAIRRAGPRTTFLIYDLDVPMEPGLLRAWLDRVTNARPIGDTDVVAWP